MLSAFGVFWTGEGLGVAWPGEDLAICRLALLFLAVGRAQWSWRAARGRRSCHDHAGRMCCASWPGCFVDDGALALAIVAVVVLAGILAALMPGVPLVAGAVLLFGCLRRACCKRGKSRPAVDGRPISLPLE